MQTFTRFQLSLHLESGQGREREELKKGESVRRGMIFSADSLFVREIDARGKITSLVVM